MPGRLFSSATGYRYGFNGKENDDEVKGIKGSQQDYGFRIYDPRLGKFLSVDPLTKSYPMYTPYSFAGNKPINSVDIDGLEESLHITYTQIAGGFVAKSELNLFGEDEVRNGQLEALATSFGVDPSYLWSLIPTTGGVSIDMTVESGKITSFRATSLASVDIIEERYTFGQKIVNFLERVIRPGKSNTSGEGNGPIQSAEGGVKANLALFGLEEKIGARVTDESGSDKTEMYATTNVTSQKDISYNAKAYLKFNLKKPSTEDSKLLGTINLGNFYLQLSININSISSGVESFEVGAQAKSSDKPNVKIESPMPSIK